MSHLPSRLRRLAVAAAAALVLVPVAHAQQKGDQWEVTVRMEMPGMTMPAQTVRMCLDKKARDESYVPQGRGDCKVVDTHKSGNTLRYRMECSGKDALSTEGEITWSGDSYAGKMHMKGKSGSDSFDMSQTFAGRKVGECNDPMH